MVVTMSLEGTQRFTVSADTSKRFPTRVCGDNVAIVATEIDNSEDNLDFNYCQDDVTSIRQHLNVRRV
jgi:hypothetical protein